jgi:hypothetical protein
LAGGAVGAGAGIATFVVVLLMFFLEFVFNDAAGCAGCAWLAGGVWGVAAADALFPMITIY